MSVLGSIGGFFKKLGTLAVKALGIAGDAGLTNDIIADALYWVKVASTRLADNAQKREFVVQMIMSKGIPEYIARLAVELAYTLFKKEIARIPDVPPTPPTIPPPVA